MNRLSSRFLYVVPIMAVAMILAATVAQAQNTKSIDGGRTTITFAENVSILADFGIDLGTVSPTKIEDGKVDFPVTGGAIDLENGNAQIFHSGGVTFTHGKHEVKFYGLIVDYSRAAPVITGLIVGDGKLLGRFPVFDLKPPSGEKLPLRPDDGELKFSDLKVTLDVAAAEKLKTDFELPALPKDFEIGTAQITLLLSSK
jgi:hypothetical protein